MNLSGLLELLDSNAFTNLILVVTLIVAWVIGRGQIKIADVVEIYGIPSTKEIKRLGAGPANSTFSPIINLQNVGTRMVYLDKYVFNGSEYITNGQVLPPSYFQTNAIYWVDLPNDNGKTDHVSLILYYKDLDGRRWKSEILADLQNNGSWDIQSLPRKRNKD